MFVSTVLYMTWWESYAIGTNIKWQNKWPIGWHPSFWVVPLQVYEIEDLPLNAHCFQNIKNTDIKTIVFLNNSENAFQ